MEKETHAKAEEKAAEKKRKIQVTIFKAQNAT